jgi:ZIP family zinc transporter/zinc and cadmium transporter
VILALLLGLITTVANLLGAALAVGKRSPSRRFLAASVGFGGGFLLAAALLELVPEAMEAGAHMAGFIALGYLLVFFVERILRVHMHSLLRENEHPSNPHGAAAVATTPSPALVSAAGGLATVVAFNVHDLIDGLAIGSAMVAGEFLGLLVFFAVLLHEFPAGFALASVMRGSGYKRWAAFMAGVSIGLITLLGIAIPFWIGDISGTAVNVLLALATGTFIYLGASILVPAAETGGRRWDFLFVAFGFGLFYATSRILGHGH